MRDKTAVFFLRALLPRVRSCCFSSLFGSQSYRHRCQSSGLITPFCPVPPAKTLFAPPLIASHNSSVRPPGRCQDLVTRWTFAVSPPRHIIVIPRHSYTAHCLRMCALSLSFSPQ